MVTKDFQTVSLRSLLLAGAAAVAASSWTVPALAQDDDDEETFVITGSRIARTDVTSENPVTIYSGEELRSNGLNNLGESLRQALSTGSGGFGQSSTLSGGGATSIDLRNFGANRVLILINGRRVASFSDSLSNLAGDLSQIPLAMVDRVEILRDGASTVYGSDAITGVVNVILRDDYEGMNISLGGGMSTHGDAESTNISATMGGNFARGNIVASLEYRTFDNVRATERDWAIPSITSLSQTGYNNGSFFSPGGTLTISGWPLFCTEPEFFGGMGTANLFTTYAFIGGGLGGIFNWLDQWNGANGFGTAPNAPGCTSGRSASGPIGNGRSGAFTRYDYAIRQDILNGQNVFSAAFYGTYDVTNWATAFMEFQFSNRESDSRLDGNPGSFGTTAFTSGSIVPFTNPFLPSELVGVMNPATGGSGFGLFAFRPSDQLGVRQSTTDNDTVRTVVGLQGDDLFNMFSWELAYLWTQNRGNLFTNSTWNLARFNRISDPYACGLDPQCSAVLSAGGKTPYSFDPITGIWTTSGDGALDSIRPGNWTVAERDYMRQNTVSTTDFETTNWSGLISADIFELPAGPVGFAAGFEFREEQGFNKPDPVTEAGESVANAVGTSRGEFDVTEFFGEIFIPVFSGMQWAEDLTVSLQGRWFDYSTFGDDTTWKIGVNYQITPSWRVRYNQGTAFRAPDVSEAFGGNVASFDFFTDPCAVGAAEQSNPNVSPNCALSTGPHTISGGLNTSTFTQPSPQYAVTRGSNPGLGPESADTMSIGVIYTPTYLPNFSATLDWWQIEVANFIGINSSDSIVDSCYQGPVGLTAPACSLFFRNAAGAIVGLTNLPSNFNTSVYTDGIDWKVDYFWDQLGGTFTANFEGTHVWENGFFPGEGGLNNNTGSIVQTSMLTSLDYARNNWGVTWRSRVTGDLDDPNFDGNNLFGYDGAEEHVEHDLRGRYQWNNYAFLLGVNNLFDEEPPFAQGSSSNADVFTYSAVGRYYFARVSADF